MSTAVAKRTATAVKLRPIAEVVVQIRGHFYDATTLQGRADKHRVQAGQLLLQLRTRIEAGEEGDVSWWEWFEKAEICRSRKDAERLMRIASAEVPEQALENEREKTRLAVAKHREKKAVELTVSSKPVEPKRETYVAPSVEPRSAPEVAYAQFITGAAHTFELADYDGEIVDAEIIMAALDVADAWAALAEKLKQASTLPQDRRSEDALADLLSIKISR